MAIAGCDYEDAHRAGTGREVTKGGLLQRPLAMAMAPNGHLLVTGPQRASRGSRPCRRQADLRAMDRPQRLQSPPGNGDLFGMAMKADGKGFYYVEDEMEHTGSSEIDGARMPFGRPEPS